PTTSTLFSTSRPFILRIYESSVEILSNLRVPRCYLRQQYPPRRRESSESLENLFIIWPEKKAGEEGASFCNLPMSQRK
ncbi:hypothetical protein K0M31_019079, partial [Melipona bicolor]